MYENEPFDALIAGAGAAGASAALVLGRARARVLLVDEGRPSNLASTGIGGLLGNDGTQPADFYRRASEELAAYPSVVRHTGRVTAIRPGGTSRWWVALEDDEQAATDRILLAAGMRYAMPVIDGIGPKWGASVFHCPFCHGWEHRDQPLAALGAPLERAFLLRRWTDDLTLIAHGVTVTDADRHRLDRAGIRVVDGEAVAFHGPGRVLEAVELADGSLIEVTGLLVPAPHELRDPALLEGLGIELTATGHVMVDPLGATSVPGIWAAGDLTSPVANVARAVGGGSTAAVAIVHDMVSAEHPPAGP